MKKILHVVGRMHYGGMETLIMNLYRHMNREKIQFDILAYYEEPGEYDLEVRELGGNVYVVRKTLNPVIYLKNLRSFFEKHHDYDVIHVHILWLAWIYFLFADKYKIKKIVHIHAFGAEQKGIYQLIRNKFIKISLKEADVVFTCSKKAAYYRHSDTQKTYLLKNGIEGAKFYYNAITRKEVRSEFGLEGKKVLLCVARFNLQKNHNFLIDVMERIVEYDNNVILVLVGKGPLESAIRKKVEKLRLNKHVRFMGVRDDVNRILQAADAYIMPSLFEGLSIVYIESQAAGVRTFASDEACAGEEQISDLFLHRPLADGEQKWASWILANMAYERINRKGELVKSGFEIEKTARALQCFYTGERKAAELFEKV